jgi:hypothetical protein
MAQMAPFVATLDPSDRTGLAQAALDRLGPDAPPLVRRIVLLTAVVA